MQGIVDALNRYGADWATLVVAIVWQSTLVALLVAVVAAALSRASPAARYWLWQIVAIKLLIVPLWSWSLALPWLPASATDPPPAAPLGEPVAVTPIDEKLAAARSPVAHATGVDRPSRPLAELTWRGWLFAGWAAIVLVRVGRLAVQRFRLSRLLAKATAGDERLVSVVHEVATRLKLKRPPRVVLGDFEGSPFVCGIVRPVLVLPRELPAVLGTAELDAVVAHELAHVKRRDLIWAWIPEIARTLYFFHPVAHLASYRIRLERELACDQLAMFASGRGPAEYAETLVRVLSSASRPSIFSTSAATPLDGGTPPITNRESKRSLR